MFTFSVALSPCNQAQRSPPWDHLPPHRVSPLHRPSKPLLVLPPDQADIEATFLLNSIFDTILFYFLPSKLNNSVDSWIHERQVAGNLQKCLLHCCCCLSQPYPNIKIRRNIGCMFSYVRWSVPLLILQVVWYSSWEVFGPLICSSGWPATLNLTKFEVMVSWCLTWLPITQIIWGFEWIFFSCWTPSYCAAFF